MSRDDREEWDARYGSSGLAPVADGKPEPPPLLADYEDRFPTRGSALELACGRGRSTVWLASRGMSVRAVDVSPVAIRLAKDLATSYGLNDRCRFDVFDLDKGLPPGPQVNLLFCHLFRAPLCTRT